ncbi:MAG: sulfatase, partial [Planctomycetota bacterium]
MKRREFIKGAAGAAIGLAGLGRSGLAQVRETKRTKKRPNVVFIFDDQLRAQACSIYGGRNITTPNMERMARQGMVFNNATSTCPLCTPFRGMLQTGRYPTHSGLVINWVETNTSQRCLAHVFEDAGYHTGFIGKWHLAAGKKKYTGKHEVTREDRRRIRMAKVDYLKRNPETEFVPPGPQRLGYEHWEAYNFHGSFNDYWYYEDTSKRLSAKGFETDIQTDQAIKFMAGHKDSPNPFFLMVAPHPPHPPFGPEHCPAGYLEKIPKDLHWLPNVPEDHKHRKDQLRARCYYAMSKNMDDNLGKILNFLDQSGLSNNTIVVFTADHGEMFGSQNRENKMVPYAEAIDIPLIIRWPGRVPAGVRSDVLHTPMDHMPTLCGLAGLDAPDTADGMDLSGVLLGKRKVDRDAILMMNYVSNWDYFDTGTLWPEWRGVRTERFTYARWLSGKEELYDNLEDPYQMRNLAEGHKDLPTLKKLRARLKDLLADAHDEFLPGTAYADWYDDARNLVKTALG